MSLIINIILKLDTPESEDTITNQKKESLKNMPKPIKVEKPMIETKANNSPTLKK